jgi:hypothetical protein
MAVRLWRSLVPEIPHLSGQTPHVADRGSRGETEDKRGQHGNRDTDDRDPGDRAQRVRLPLAALLEFLAAPTGTGVVPTDLASTCHGDDLLESSVWLTLTPPLSPFDSAYSAQGRQRERE